MTSRASVVRPCTTSARAVVPHAVVCFRRREWRRGARGHISVPLITLDELSAGLVKPVVERSRQVALYADLGVTADRAGFEPKARNALLELLPASVKRLTGGVGKDGLSRPASRRLPRSCQSTRLETPLSRESPAPRQPGCTGSSRTDPARLQGGVNWGAF